MTDGPTGDEGEQAPELWYPLLWTEYPEPRAKGVPVPKLSRANIIGLIVMQVIIFAALIATTWYFLSR